MSYSPYENLSIDEWLDKTNELIHKHPLNNKDIVGAVLESWSDIFKSIIGNDFVIGKDIFPKPQILGFFLHELIALKLSKKYPSLWRNEETVSDKDLVYKPNDFFSIEIKTSSNKNNIYGNRSYAQKSATSKKSKSGFYLAINFEKITKQYLNPEILLIRFGWLDHDDWVGQKASTGQQASLNTNAKKYKLVTLYLSE